MPQTGELLSSTPRDRRVRWWHWLTGVGLVSLLVVLAPRERSPEFSHLTEGSISRSDVIAPFDFEILKNSDELETERRDAAAAVLPVLSWNDSISGERAAELIRFAGQSRQV